MKSLARENENFWAGRLGGVIVGQRAQHTSPFNPSTVTLPLSPFGERRSEQACAADLVILETLRPVATLTEVRNATYMR